MRFMKKNEPMPYWKYIAVIILVAGTHSIRIPDWPWDLLVWFIVGATYAAFMQKHVETRDQRRYRIYMAHIRKIVKLQSKGGKDDA